MPQPPRIAVLLVPNGSQANARRGAMFPFSRSIPVTDQPSYRMPRFKVTFLGSRHASCANAETPVVVMLKFVSPAFPANVVGYVVGSAALNGRSVENVKTPGMF